MTLTNEVYTRVGIDMDMTGGMPTIPANATSEGTVDISTLAPGTVVTIITKSMSKWVLTVQEDGKAMIQQYVWFIGAHYSASNILERLSKIDKFIDSLEDELPQIRIRTEIFIGKDKYSAASHYRNKLPVRVFNESEHIVPFSAGDQLSRKSNNTDIKMSGKILFWTINE